MMDGDIPPPAVLHRNALVYAQHLTQAQVELDTDDQRRQYESAAVSRRCGFRTVDVIHHTDQARKRHIVDVALKPEHAAPSTLNE